MLLVGGTQAYLRAQEAGPPVPPVVQEHVHVEAPLLVPSRESSGTSWQPDAAPMYGVHRRWGRWDVRVDGSVFVNLMAEPGERHRTGGPGTMEPGSRNWAMVTGRRGVSNGRVGWHAMVSAEPWTNARCGSLSFLATGEVCDRETVHDREPPADLVMELSADFERRLIGNWRWQVYAALAGDPAFGPPSHIRRASALLNPIGPMGHHWVEGTTAFGVLTASVRDRQWNIEWSFFNGRTPDDSRTDVDISRFDSTSARLTHLATDRLAFQASLARLRDARSDFPYETGEPVSRLTASALYYRPLGAAGLWATTMTVGLADRVDIIPGGLFRSTTGAALIESSLTVSGGHTFFGRAETAELPGHHLHVIEAPTTIFVVGKLQAGYVREGVAKHGLVLGGGGAVALSVIPASLAPRYPGRVAPSLVVFLSLRAARHTM